ncbi:hypothetical protein DJ66_0677 [Candidatus Liberibacter solanacearum]|uniref:Uncharacterized protein n=1 Tax=Candidatus Liberibacter solanacearum TaxID=556287 RepID=A0A0F4VMM8_9HYPH|nr:hypothetical protein DJ66_0677 [Candidatus Liberibacter solanacearum]
MKYFFIIAISIFFEEINSLILRWFVKCIKNIKYYRYHL